MSLLSFVYQDTDEKVCAICYTQIKCREIVTALECKHIYHTDCISQWFENNTSCPLCRNDDIFARISKACDEL